MQVRGQKINVPNLVICIVGIAILVAVGIVPAERKLKEMDRKIATLQYQVEEQKLLFPFFVQLLQRSREKAPPLLPSPEQEKMPRGDTTPLTTQFREIAAKNGIAVERLRPEVESLLDRSGRVKMLAGLYGGFHDLRNFLIQVGEVPYLDQIEYIRVEGAKEDQALQVNLRFWVLQE